jgi:hypothetical protein
MGDSIFAALSNWDHTSSVHEKTRMRILTVPMSSMQTRRSEAPHVDLTEDHPSATVTLLLGEKAGVLVGKVIDVDTGAAVKTKLVFMDEDGNDHSVLANGEYRALLPQGKNVTLMVMVMVMSPDYHPQSPVAPLRLEPGQEMHMDIRVSKQ